MPQSFHPSFRRHRALGALPVLVSLGLAPIAWAQDGGSSTEAAPGTIPGTAPAEAPAAAPQVDVGPAPVIQDTASMDPALVTLLTELLAKIEADPTSVDARAQLGLAYEANTIHSLAEASYDQALALGPTETQWLFRRGIARFSNGDLDGAIVDLRGTAAVFKNTPVVQARLGDALRVAGDLEGAEAAWRTAIAAEAKQNPNVPYAASRVGLAQVLLDLEQFEEAESLCREALGLAPQYRHAHYILGLTLMEMDRPEEGAVELAAGETAYPEFPPGPHDLALRDYRRGYSRRMMVIENLVQAGALPEAKARLDAMLSERPDDHMVLNLAASTALRSGDVAAARALLERSITAAPDEPATFLQACVVELEQANRVSMQMQQFMQAQNAGQPINPAQLETVRSQGAELAAAALERATRAVEIAPAVGRYHYWLGVSHQTSASFMTDQNAAGQVMQTALGSFQNALVLGCTEPMFNQQIATLYGQMGRVREMLRYALRHLAGRPADIGALYLVVQAHFNNQKQDEVLPYIQRLDAAATAAKDAGSLQYVIQAYLTVGELDAAEVAIGPFQAAAPGNPQAAQFVVAVQGHIQAERAKQGAMPAPPSPPVKEPAEGTPPPAEGAGGDPAPGSGG